MEISKEQLAKTMMRAETEEAEKKKRVVEEEEEKRIARMMKTYSQKENED
eukprot:gene13798-4881_t